MQDAFAKPRTLAVVDNDIAVALVAGLSAIAAAVVGLVGVRSAGSEPSATKELIALATILKDFPEGEAKEALEGRRARVALAHGTQRQPLNVFTAAYWFVFGGYLLFVLPLLILGGDANAWRSLFNNALIGVAIGGIIFSLIGVALFVAGAWFKVREWRQNRPQANGRSESVYGS